MRSGKSLWQKAVKSKGVFNMTEGAFPQRRSPQFNPQFNPQSLSDFGYISAVLSEKAASREASDMCEFFQECIVPFKEMFLRTDDYAMLVTDQWVTVDHMDPFGMKVCSKIFVKLYDPKVALFLVEWGDEKPAGEEQTDWVELRDIRNGRANPTSTDCWLGIQAKATDGEQAAVEDVSRRRGKGERTAETEAY